MMGCKQLESAMDESVPFCEWSDDYLVGIKKMDKQHIALFSTLNKLHDILRTHGSQSLIDQGLSELIHQTRVHFHSEEEYMQAHSYPNYDSHKELHDLLLQQIEGLLETQHELESYHIQQSWSEKLELADFLRGWLVSHIIDSDKKLGAFLKSKKVE